MTNDDRIIEVMARAHMDRGVGPPDPKLLRRVKRSLADLREAGLVVVDANSEADKDKSDDRNNHH